MKWFFLVFFAISFVFLAVFGINCFYGYFFPIKFEQEIALASQTFDVDEPIIFSLINIESHFNNEAVSRKGAVGLMQVMPSTASAVASQIGLRDFDLKNAEENIFIGTYYLSNMLERFENLETALCAYNAGPSNVASWLKNSSYSDDGKTLKMIPFEETRSYVQKFWKNFNYYKTKK